MAKLVVVKKVDTVAFKDIEEGEGFSNGSNIFMKLQRGGRACGVEVNAVNHLGVYYIFYDTEEVFPVDLTWDVK